MVIQQCSLLYLDDWKQAIEKSEQAENESDINMNLEENISGKRHRRPPAKLREDYAATRAINLDGKACCFHCVAKRKSSLTLFLFDSLDFVSSVYRESLSRIPLAQSIEHYVIVLYVGRRQLPPKLP